MLQNGCLHVVLILQGSLKGYFYFALEKTPPNQKNLKSLCEMECLFCAQLPSGWLGTWLGRAGKAGCAHAGQQELYIVKI